MDNNNLYVRKNMHNTTVTLLVTSLVAILVIFISIGYSAINASLMVTGDLEYEAPKRLYDIVAKESRGLDTNIDFGVAPTEATSGVYKMNSTNSANYPVYYYRGIVNNNNIKFAGFCWKMVRTTETGGVKIIYNGVPGSDGSCNNTGSSSYIAESNYNNKMDSEDVLSYMFDDGTDSLIKKVIDEWYKINLINYNGKLEDTEWCNDRSVANIIDRVIQYGPTKRIIINKHKPSIICPNTSDKYTVSNSKGNGRLIYPIALLTVDEVVLAGMLYNDANNNNYGNSYLDIGTGSSMLRITTWWTMSPAYFNYPNTLRIFNVIGKKVSTHYDISSVNPYAITGGVRPSISLIPNTMVYSSGDGSISNPYQLTD